MSTPLPDEVRLSAADARPGHGFDRRHVLKVLAGLGIGTAVFQRSLALAVQEAPRVTAEMIEQAEWITGLKLTEAQRKALTNGLNVQLREVQRLRDVKLDNSVAPALTFQPAPWQRPESSGRGTVEPTVSQTPPRPEKGTDLAFLPVTTLSALIRSRQVSSVELTKLYLERLEKFDPVLHCVVTRTDKLALEQAERADRELAAGRVRGPLHGIPWGAKDLIAYPGYPTTWGAAPYKEQTLDTKATVARRLEDAGAVLVAKLTLGALALGDRWFGGMTRNPWNPQTGSSGSSAGSASASVAGLVGFALGSETLGSIVSPCTVCGATGLRPTFGRVSRHGCMTLSWSMDKIGPIGRSVEDCALVFGAIHGADGQDGAAVDRSFVWPCRRDLRSLRVGYIENGTAVANRPELKVLRDLGVRLVPIKLPDRHPLGALRLILNVESATAFDDLMRKGDAEGLEYWLSEWRRAAFIPAVEYVRANRIRSQLMQDMEEVMTQVDLYVGGNDLLLTNLTGHPTVVLPNGFRKRGDVETPTALTFSGRLYGETELLAVAHAYQQATGHHLRRPPLDKVMEEKPEKK
jgi:Asp-tRNA(Asn)/Glu-tRNA(Gln) amidotransferase A subunit family amidase